MPESQNTLLHRGRRVQLDGLRWFAVLGVMISHYLDPHELYSNVGGWGVRVFFVLSGFLIGSILFDAKNRVTRSESSVGKELKNFYARRTLRIFPAFYLLVFVTWLLGNWSSAPFGWIALYAVNVWEVVHCEIAGIFGHLYTLCIEEHFYLFFPLLIFVVPLLRLNALLWTLICLGVMWRLVAIDILHWCNGTRLVFSELDSLAGGALTASLIRVGRLRPGNGVDKYWTVAAVVCGGAYLLNFYSLRLLGVGISSTAVSFSLFTVFACWLVYKAAFGFAGPIGKALSWRPFVYLGTISYGIYLYHNFAGWFVTNAALRVGLQEPLHVLAAFGLQVLWTICVASLSWWLLEQPCNRLKRYFESNAQIGV
jgi:peptidoglycan/LPS O-acetylase OafA/YrhL